MAAASGHKFGQALGEFCERAIEPLLREIAERHGLYLDKQGPRPARRGKKVEWTDSYGNAHDLDYVLERGGTPEEVGTPVAFIESAWRRYTKHSRNKAQEIQGAVVPVRDKYYYSAPFLGCFLAGDFTAGALGQLRSLGFRLLHFDYASIVDAFRIVGIDAQFDEATPDEEFSKKQRKWQKLPLAQRERVWRELVRLNRERVDEFMAALQLAVTRRISAVRIIPLHGVAVEWPDVQQAIQFVRDYQEQGARGPLVKYEVQVRYDNGDRVDASFQERDAVIEFLDHYRNGHWVPSAKAVVDGPSP